jgi:hypothetical protein
MKHWMGGLVCAVCLVGSAAAQVVTSVWSVGSGGWNTGGNWNPSGVPASDNNTRVEFNTGAGGVVDQDTSGSFLLNQLVFGAEAGSFTLSGLGLIFQSTPNPDFFDPRLQVSSLNPQIISNDLELLDEVMISGGEQTDVTLAGNVTGNGAVRVALPTGGRVRYREGTKNYEGQTRVENGRVDLETDHRVLGNLMLESSNAVYSVLPGGVVDLRSKVLGAGGLLNLTGGVILVQSGGGIGEANTDVEFCLGCRRLPVHQQPRASCRDDLAGGHVDGRGGHAGAGVSSLDAGGIGQQTAPALGTNGSERGDDYLGGG